MKYSLIFLSIIFLISCGNQKKPAHMDANFEWLVGDWVRTNNKGDNLTHEHWLKFGEKQYFGFGYTMRGEDTIFQEEMHIFSRDSLWILAVASPEDSIDTEFIITKFEPLSFESENPDNEFPKIIKYFKTSDGLNAIISGSGMEVEFVFEPIEP